MDHIKDASSIFLWEDSADSEMDRLLSRPNELESVVDDQDDARSCNCDDYATDLRVLDSQDDGDQAVGLIRDGFSDQLDGRRRSETALEYNSDEEEEEESSNNVGMIRDMNEMKDTVFWDTCMAEGYP